LREFDCTALEREVPGFSILKRGVVLSDSLGGGRRRSTGFAAAAVLLAASALLSRVLGLVRDRVIAHQIGASSETDAYSAAFLIPDILNYFLAGGALSIAFIPLYSRLRAGSGDASAAALFDKVLGTMGAVVVAATALLWWQADAIVPRVFAGFSAETQILTTRLVRILLPAQIFFVVGGIVRAVLMARGRFGSQALAPLLYNAGIIVCGAAWGARLGAEAFAWGALIGAAVGPFLIPMIEVWRDPELRPRPRLAPFDPVFLQYLAMAAPLMIGVSLLTVDEWYDKVFGAQLAEGTVAYLGFGRRLAQVPIGVLGQAIATAALPTLSKLWAERRLEDLDDALLAALRSGLALGIIAAVGLFAFAHPVVVLIIETGRFSAADSDRVAALLMIFAIAIPAWITQQIAVRAFYARGEMWLPMLLGTGVAIAFIPLYLALGSRAEGLAVAGVIGMTTSAVLTLALARFRHGGPALAPLLSSGLRAAAIAAAAGGVAAWAGAQVAGAFATLALGGAIFTALCLAGARWFGDEPMRGVVDRLVRGARRWVRRAG
jgi:putative peptidoglycan lipid II flippase